MRHLAGHRYDYKTIDVSSSIAFTYLLRCSPPTLRGDNVDSTYAIALCKERILSIHVNWIRMPAKMRTIDYAFHKTGVRRVLLPHCPFRFSLISISAQVFECVCVCPFWSESKKWIFQKVKLQRQPSLNESSLRSLLASQYA